MTSPLDPGAPAANIVKGAKTLAGWIGSGAQQVTGVIPGADAANTLIDSIAASRRWLAERHNWTRVAWTIGGTFLMYMGVLMLAKPQIESAVQAAGKAAEILPAGKIAKVVGK